jgi:ABC-type proline/glycine betaine transport system substrate-binding protein
MAITKTAKIDAEIVKVDSRISELQAKRRELVQKRLAAQNGEIVDLVRGLNVPLDELAAMLQAVKGGGAPPASTSGQIVPKSALPEKDETEDAE